MRPDSSRSPGPGRLVHRGLLALLLACLLSAGSAHGAAAADRSGGPKLNAASWMLVDLRDGAELAAADPGRRRAIASTTKLMTAYLALRRLRLDQKLEVPDYEPGPAESVAGLRPGEKLTVRDLLLAMLLPSANDAAETVAVGVSGSERSFVEAMNRAARSLGLSRTHYSNPIGLDEKGNFSTAADLSDLAIELLGDRRFRHMVSRPRAKLRSGSQTRRVTNTNTLLFTDPSVDGVKTGHTLDAGYVLVASAKRRGVPLLAAVLGAPSEADRNAETAALLDYGYSLYKRRDAVGKGEVVASATVEYADRPLPLEAQRAIEVSARSDQEVQVDVAAPEQVEGPIDAGDRLGDATVTVDGRFIARTPILAARAIAAPTVIDRIGAPVAAALIGILAVAILALAVFVFRRRGNGEGSSERDPEERMKTREERIRNRNGGGSG